MIVLVLIVLPCAPLGWQVLNGPSLPIIYDFNHLSGMIASSDTHLGIITPS